MFAIPTWSVDLSGWIAEHLDVMKADVERTLLDSPADAPFQQTTASFDKLETSPWPGYHRLLSEIASGLIAQTWKAGTIEVGHLATWALKITGSDGRGSSPHLHAHPRAVLSAVLYLQLPDELVGNPDGGTVFRDPNANNSAFMNTRPWYVHTPQPLELLVFPSWVEHAPSQTHHITTYSSPRLVLSTDVIGY